MGERNFGTIMSYGLVRNIDATRILQPRQPFSQAAGCGPDVMGCYGGADVMQRRTFLGTALAVANASPLFAALGGGRWDDAAAVLEKATAAKQVDAAALHVAQKDETFTRHFGKAASNDAMFLLGSISKPVNVTAVMTVF